MYTFLSRFYLVSIKFLKSSSELKDITILPFPLLFRFTSISLSKFLPRVWIIVDNKMIKW